MSNDTEIWTLTFMFGLCVKITSGNAQFSAGYGVYMSAIFASVEVCMTIVAATRGMEQGGA